MALSRRSDPKLAALAQTGTAHRHAESVHDPQWRAGAFFDPRDLLQVKYEMVRRVRIEGASIQAAATAFGFSRPAFYHALRSFERAGLAGLVPLRPGPRHAHKLTDEVLDFVEQCAQKVPAPTTTTLLAAVQKRFGIAVHRRSLERARARRGKRAAEAAPSRRPPR